MDAKFLVLDKEVVQKVLTQEENMILQSFVEKIREFEGYRVYEVHVEK